MSNLVYGDSHVARLDQVWSSHDPLFVLESRPGCTSEQAYDWQWSVVLGEESYDNVILCLGTNDPPGGLETLRTLCTMKEQIEETEATAWIWKPPALPMCLLPLWRETFGSSLFDPHISDEDWYDQTYLKPEVYARIGAALVSYILPSS